MSMPLVFGDPESIRQRDAYKLTKRARIDRMHAAHGTKPGFTCGDCKHLVINGGHQRNYWKCRQYGVSNGAATDWCGKWSACGLFEKRKE